MCLSYNAEAVKSCINLIKRFSLTVGYEVTSLIPVCTVYANEVASNYPLGEVALQPVGQISLCDFYGWSFDRDIAMKPCISE